MDQEKDYASEKENETETSRELEDSELKEVSGGTSSNSPGDPPPESNDTGEVRNWADVKI